MALLMRTALVTCGGAGPGAARAAQRESGKECDTWTFKIQHLSASIASGQGLTLVFANSIMGAAKVGNEVHA